MLQRFLSEKTFVTTVEKQRGIVGNEIQTTEHFIMENRLLLRKH